MNDIYKFFVALIALIMNSSFAQLDTERAYFPVFAESADLVGVTWQHHYAKTEDGWYLSMFRLTGLVDKQPNYLQDKNKDKLPIIMQHGSFSSAQDWLSGGVLEIIIETRILGPTLPTQLVQAGYDVWVVSNRGYANSDFHERDGQEGWTLKEKWDFSWADMGTYDVPAFVEKALEVTGKPKVTLLGYS